MTALLWWSAVHCIEMPSTEVAQTSREWRKHRAVSCTYTVGGKHTDIYGRMKVISAETEINHELDVGSTYSSVSLENQLLMCIWRLNYCFPVSQKSTLTSSVYSFCRLYNTLILKFHSKALIVHVYYDCAIFQRFVSRNFWKNLQKYYYEYDLTKKHGHTESGEDGG